MPLRISYEVTRVALHSGLPLADLSEHVMRQLSNGVRDLEGFDDYESLWQTLGNYVTVRSRLMPERTSMKVWQAAMGGFERVSLCGEISFGKTASDPPLNLQLKPMAFGDSYRLARKYGFHRFMNIIFPSLELQDLPGYLRQKGDSARNAIYDWLVNGVHYLLGRQWKVFYSKPKDSNSKLSKELNGRYRLCFFAVGGRCFSRAHPSPDQRIVPLKDMLEWFLPFKSNKDQPLLKLFSRLQLGA